MYWTADVTGTWSPAWQAGEREADVEIAAGDLSPVYGSADEMFADLDRRMCTAGASAEAVEEI